MMGLHHQIGRSTLETIGRTIIPTFNVRIGWLI
jgi:hypothetical protein